jgi:ubiquinone/menaquinone biosynthesis C-methylase UbiE
LGDVLHAVPTATGYGVDVSDAMIRHARRVLDAWSIGDRAKLMVGDLRRLPLPDSSLDFVVATEVLEHLPDPRDGIRELARVLSAEGVLVTSIPVNDTAPTHLHLFETVDDVLRLHRSAGLAVRRHRVMNVAPNVPDVLIAACRA